MIPTLMPYFIVSAWECTLIMSIVNQCEASFLPKRVVLASNGYADGNAEAIAEYLNSKKIEMLCVVKHPLERFPHPYHQMKIYNFGQLKKIKLWNPPCYPPFTYIFDMLYPTFLSIPKSDVWIGFGNLNTLRGLHAKYFGRTRHVIYDCVDFSPARFGRGFLTKVYDVIDRISCRGADLIWPISDKSHAARLEKHQFSNPLPFHTVPMGAWLARVPKAKESSLKEPRIVFLGHLIEKQGLQATIEALSHVKKVFPAVTLHVIGSGPFAGQLQSLVNRLGFQEIVIFHGFVKEHQHVEAILASGSVAVATYVPDQADFTRFADPGKLKAYLGAGLPIVLTDVSPNAREIMERAGGEITSYDPQTIAEKLINILKDPDDWRRRSEMALQYMKQFDWNIILDLAFKKYNEKLGAFR